MSTHYTFPGDLESLHDQLDHDGLVDYSDLTGTPSSSSSDDPILASENANHLESISESLQTIVSAMDGAEKLFLGTAPMGLQLAGEQLAAQSVPVALATEHIKDAVLQNTVPIGALGVNACNPNGGVIDCLQYRSISIQIQTVAGSAGALAFEGSNDGINFCAVVMFDAAAYQNAPVSTLTLAASVNRFFVSPLYFRYFRARISTIISGGICSIFTTLRMIPFSAPQSVNISTYGNSGVILAGVSGLPAVGGNIAPGTAATANPVPVGGVDLAGRTRRFLSDVPGNLAMVGPDPTFSGQAAPVLTKDVAPAGMSQQDLLWRILIELRSMAHCLNELPLHLNAGKQFTDTVSDFSNEIRIIN